MFPKRRKEQQKQETTKSSRKNIEMRNPSPHGSDSGLSDISSSSDDIDSHQYRRQQRKDRSKAVARHIAVHLQVLMLLTLRFTALQREGEGVDDDIRSDSVDIDEESSTSGGTDQGGISNINFQADATMKSVDDENNMGDATDPDDDVVEDDIPIPDTDLDLEFIPRQYDDLAAKDDEFLNEVIESGTYQSWRNLEGKAEESGSHLTFNCLSNFFRYSRLIFTITISPLILGFYTLDSLSQF
jgi:hypothetical protein